MYSKYIMDPDTEFTASLNTNSQNKKTIDEVINDCKAHAEYTSIEDKDKDKFEAYVKNEYQILNGNGTFDPAELIKNFKSKIDGGRRRPKSSKKRATRRRRSSKRKARKARTTRRKY